MNKMSFKQITVTTNEGDVLLIGASRKVRREKKIIAPFRFRETGKIIKKVTVQYGIGVGGEGASLKEAVAIFKKNWSDFCANR
jgi:hypothetical protein